MGELTTPLYEGVDLGENNTRSTAARGYGGPAFDPKQYIDEAQAGQYLTYERLYEDVQMELDNIAGWLQQKWGIGPRDLIWFEDSLEALKYASNLTIEQTWQEDLENGTRYLEELHEWLVENEAMHGEDPEPLDAAQLAELNPQSMSSIKAILWNYDWDALGPDDWDINWGPYEWDPLSQGEWTRCRDIAMSRNEDFPVSVLVNGSMIDGAHRLAVALFERKPYHSCLVGVPAHWFEQGNG